MENLKPRSQFWTIFLNLILPGFGYFYLGQVRRALAVLGFFYFFSFISVYLNLSFPGFLLFFLLGFGIYLFILIDSFKRTRGHKTFPDLPIQRKRILIPLFVVCASMNVLMSELKRTKSYINPSPSMCPSVHVGDRIIVDEKAPIVRGGIYVHANPQDPSTIFIKRLIGLPGDKIAIKSGDLFINGKSVFTSKRPVSDQLKEGCSSEIAEENLKYSLVRSMIYEGKIDDQNFSFLATDSSFSWMDLEETMIPQGHYFFIGDNLNNSLDSRFYGPIEAKHLLGRALYSYFSSHNGKVFWNRIGHSYLGQ